VFISVVPVVAVYAPPWFVAAIETGAPDPDDGFVPITFDATGCGFDQTYDNALTDSTGNGNLYYGYGGTVQVETFVCDDCPACCTDILATISGLTGDCGTYFNGDYILNKVSGFCQWDDGATPQKLAIIKNPLDDRFTIRLYSDQGYVGLSEEIFEDVDGCIPDGTYTITFYNGNDCTGQTGTITIACSDIG
jgi:hypothetical protein